MRLLVTGGTGFTGSHLVRRARREGHAVTSLDNSEGLFADELRGLGATIRLGSVTDRELLREIIPGHDVIFHVAAAFRDVSAHESVYWNVNVDGTRHVLEEAAAAGVKKVVYCSTQGVHGHIDDPPGDEESPIKPADYYQYTKWEGERVCHEFMDAGMDITIIRPTAIYGPGDPGRFVMLFKAARKGRFLMFGDGRTTYHPVYIDNLVDLFFLATEHPKASGRTFIGADLEYYTLDDLVRAVGESIDVNVRIVHLPLSPLWLASAAVELICKPFSIAPPLFRRRADWFRQVRAFKIDRAKNELGYEPKIELAEGLKRTGRWYTENGYI